MKYFAKFMQIVKNITIIRGIYAPKYENTNRVISKKHNKIPTKQYIFLRKGELKDE